MTTPAAPAIRDLADAGAAAHLATIRRRLLGVDAELARATQQAAAAEEAANVGRMLGLPENEIRDVIESWTARYGTRMDSDDWSMVRAALRVHATMPRKRPELVALQDAVNRRIREVWPA